MTISLLAGPIGDQMFFQRAWAVEDRSVVKTFVFGGLIFALIPLALSLLGFIGADLAAGGKLMIEDPQMVAPQVIAYLLPKEMLYLFCIMAFAGLCSTMDSAFCAASALICVDFYRRYIEPDSNDLKLLRVCRFSMAAVAVLGTGIALLEPKLLWVFLTYGAMAAAAMFPTLFVVFFKRISAGGLTWAIGLSLLIGTPLTVYANIVENPYLIVLGSLVSVLFGLAVCLGDVFRQWRAKPAVNEISLEVQFQEPWKVNLK
jgi:Na+/proline symporter